MLASRCLALASLVGNCLALEDAEALFQQRQALSSREVLSANKDEDEALSSWGPRPDNTLKGMRMTRMTSSGVGDNNVLLTTTMHCEESDSRGPKKCVFPFYVPFATYFKIKVPTFVSATDYVVVKYSSLLSYNSSTWMGVYLPRNQTVTATCQLCSSDCTYNLTNADYSLHVTTPTILGSLGVCDGKSQSMVFLKKQCAILPRPTEELGLGGSMTFALALLGADDSVKAESSYLLTPAKSEWTTVNASAASLAAVEGETYSTEGEVQGVGMADLMQLFLSGMTTRSGARKRAASSSEHATGRLSARVMVFNLTLRSAAASNSVALIFNSGCSVLNSVYYTLTCRIPVYSDATVASMAQISFNAQPGATLFWAQQLQSNAETMENLPIYFQKYSLEAPLCGTGRDTMKAKLWASMPGALKRPYTPPECGSYSFSFTTNGAKPVDWDQYMEMLTPLALAPNDELLPLSKTTWLKMTDDTGASILDAEFSMGIEKM